MNGAIILQQSWICTIIGCYKFPTMSIATVSTGEVGISSVNPIAVAAWVPANRGDLCGRDEEA